MRIIKRKRIPTNENLVSNETETDPSTNDNNKNKKNISEPTTNQASANQLLNSYHLNQQLSYMMPPPPIPPIQNTIIINQPLYPPPIDFEKLLIHQQQQHQHMLMSDFNSMYKLNDISNNSIGNLNSQKTTRNSHGGNVTHLTTNNEVYQNCVQLGNYEPKDVFSNLPKTTHLDQKTEALNTSNLAAKHSSYYSLTPASSTTSLQDLNNSNNHIENSILISNKRIKSTTSVVNRRRTIGATKTEAPNVNENAIVQPEAVKRKRGRPPKNSVPTTTPTSSYTATSSNTAIEIPVQAVIVSATTNSIQKIATSKPKNNLQRSKILDNASAVTSQTIKNIEISKEEIIKTEPVNRQEEPSPLPKLTWANANDLWKVMRRKDEKFKHDFMYLKKHTGIEPQMRAILLDWLIEISYAYRLHRETLHLALEYMDRFLTETKQEMRVDRLQLIGMTSLFLASKVEEIYPPKLKELASHMENYSNNNEEAISQFELFMLKTLNWEISPVTSNTWLMTYLQIASINYHNYLNGGVHHIDLSKEHNTHIVMPLNVYKNSSSNPKEQINPKQQEFYLKTYMKSVTLLDLCLFDMESMKFKYSILAASALYHMLCKNTNYVYNSNHLVCNLVQMCSGYSINELDSCIKWMAPYADVCKEVLGEEKMTYIKQFSSVESDDSHNIQLYYQNLELLKEAQLRKTPSKFYPNNLTNANILTPPESNRKNNQSTGIA